MSKKKKKSKKVSLRDKLDEIFSLYIRARDADENWWVKCITCWKAVYWKSKAKECHACHCIERWNYLYRRNENNVYAWCSNCNYYNKERHKRKLQTYMIKKFWLKNMEEMELNKKRLIDIKTFEMEEMIDYFTSKYEFLVTKKKLT